MNRSPSSPFIIAATATPARRQPQRVRIYWFDYAFFTMALVLICGGALFLIELAANQSTGQQTMLAQFVEQASNWMAFVSSKTATYGALLLGSILNSALLTLFVQLLRTVDRRLSRSSQPRWPSRHSYSSTAPTNPRASKAQTTVHSQATPSALRHSFLISPILS